MPTYNWYISLVFDVAIPSLLSLPSHMRCYLALTCHVAQVYSYIACLISYLYSQSCYLVYPQPIVLPIQLIHVLFTQPRLSIACHATQPVDGQSCYLVCLLHVMLLSLSIACHATYGRLSIACHATYLAYLQHDMLLSLSIASYVTQSVYLHIMLLSLSIACHATYSRLSMPVMLLNLSIACHVTYLSIACHAT